MEISHDDARQSLEEIQSLMSRTRRAISYGTTGPIIAIWGVAWILGYLSTFTLILNHRGAWINWAWMIFLSTAGLLSWLLGRKSPFKSPIEKRIGIFWGLIFLFAYMWLALMWPFDHYQAGIFVATIPMFAYVVMGLWLEENYLVWLGLAVSGLLVLGYFLLRGNPYMWLWMAVFGGGSLTGVGLYISKSWRR